MNKISFLAGLVVASAISHASFTVASYSDPATSSATPMFTWDSSKNTLEGSWTAPGMTVLTPGLNGGGQVADAHMVFDKVSLTPVILNTLYTMSSGRVRFYTNDLNNPFLTITFNTGRFLNPFSSQATNLSGDGVAFSGPNVPTGLSQEQFSFSFANAEQQGDTTKFTSSFTSSAVPEPASMIALGTGLIALMKRRRKA